jgi:hypothetical protein
MSVTHHPQNPLECTSRYLSQFGGPKTKPGVEESSAIIKAEMFAASNIRHSGCRQEIVWPRASADNHSDRHSNRGHSGKYIRNFLLLFA